MRIRTLIVEGCSANHDRIRGLIHAQPDFEIVGNRFTGEEWLSAISQLKPDLVCVGAQLPGCQMLVQLSPGQRVIVLIVDDGSKVKLLELCALDRFEAPPEQVRLAEILTDLCERRGTKQASNGFQRCLTGKDGLSDSRLVIKSEHRIVLVDTAMVRWIQACGDYVKIHLENCSYLARETMRAIESRIGSARFARIHRSAIVNLDFVSEFRRALGGDYFLNLNDGTQLRLSRSYRQNLEAKLMRLSRRSNQDAANATGRQT